MKLWSGLLIAVVSTFPVAGVRADARSDDAQDDQSSDVPPADTGDSTPPFKYTASFLARYENRNHYDTIGASRGRRLEGDATAYRARVGAGLPAVSVGGNLLARTFLTVQASGFLGELGNPIGDPPLGIYEGYARIDGSRHAFDFGRFAMLYGDGLVIGNSNWRQNGRAFQGVRARFLGPGGQYRVDVFATQTAEGRPRSDAGGGDTYFYGVYAFLGPLLSSTMEVDVYALGLTWPETDEAGMDPGDPALVTRAHATTATLGVRTKDKRGAWDYRLEAGVQMGTALAEPGLESPAAVAYHGDLAVGYSVGRLRVGLEGLYASGDDPATTDRYEGWNDLFANRHKWLGRADIFLNRTNVYSGVLHLRYALGGPTRSRPSVLAMMEAHVLARPQPVNGATGYAGAELDVAVVKNLAKGLKLSGLVSLFRPEQAIFGSEQLVTYGEVQLRLDL